MQEIENSAYPKKQEQVMSELKLGKTLPSICSHQSFQTVTGHSSTETLSDSLVCLLWERMIDLYGHKWSSMHGARADDNGVLTPPAKAWQHYLSGVPLTSIKPALDFLVRHYNDSEDGWPPTLARFRWLCMNPLGQQMPTLEKVISVLTMSSSRQGSISERYEHPAIFEISKMLDMHTLRLAKYAEAKSMVKPIYHDVQQNGYAEFPDYAYEVQAAITRESKKSSPATAKSMLESIKAML